MPTSILLRADQVIEEACLLQGMSLFLTLSGHGLEVCMLFPSAVTYFEINSG
jgi:hypothetical protein